MTIKFVLFTDGKGASKIQESLVEELKREFEDRIEFEILDREDEAFSKYSVEELPTIVIEVDGKVEERFIGLTQERFLRKALERILEWD